VGLIDGNADGFADVDGWWLIVGVCDGADEIEGA
jgi:hypothetical protein